MPGVVFYSLLDVRNPNDAEAYAIRETDKLQKGYSVKEGTQ